MGLLQKKSFKINKKNKKYYLGNFFLIVTIFFLLTFFIQKNYLLLSYVSDFLSRIIYYPTFGVKNIFFASREIENLKKENSELKKRLAETLAAKEENIFLKNSLKLSDFKGRLILGRILFYAIDNKNKAYINLGAKDNIKEGMPVVFGDAVLIGKVSKVYDNKSEIIFTTNENFVSPVVFEGLNINAVAKGDGSSIIVSINSNLEALKILPGKIVFSGNGDPLIPPRLVLGTVISLFEDKKINIYKVNVKPFINKEEINDIFVIVNF